MKRLPYLKGEGGESMDEEFDWGIGGSSDRNSGYEDKEESIDFSGDQRPSKGQGEQEVRIEGGTVEGLSSMSTVAQIEGESFDPIKNLSVLVLVEVAPEVRRRRKIPQFFYMNRPVMTIGHGLRAQVKVDDLKRVKAEHGAVAFKDGAFWLYPQEGEVRLDGKEVPKDGAPLRHGSMIEMGSAKFVFLSLMEQRDPYATKA